MTKKLFSIIICLIIAFSVSSGFAAPSANAIRELYQKAKAEGEVIWQVLGSSMNWQPMAKAFEAKYPGIKVSLFSSRGSQMPARIITESRGGKLSVDVATCAGANEILPLLERDMIVGYDWPTISEANPDDILFEGRFVPHHDAPMIWVYNTDSVSKKDVPRTWEDLLDPKWKGSKISIRSNASNLIFLFPEWRKNPQKVRDFLKRLRAQEVMPARGGTVAASRVATGECPIGVVRSVLLPSFEKKGTPLGVCPISPAVSSPFGFYTPKVKGVPHPNAAILLIAWAHTGEAKAVFRKTGRGPGSPCDASPVAKVLCDNKIEFVRIGKNFAELKEFNVFIKEATGIMGWATKKKKR